MNQEAHQTADTAKTETRGWTSLLTPLIITFCGLLLIQVSYCFCYCFYRIGEIKYPVPVADKSWMTIASGISHNQPLILALDGIGIVILLAGFFKALWPSFKFSDLKSSTILRASIYLSAALIFGWSVQFLVFTPRGFEPLKPEIYLIEYLYWPLQWIHFRGNSPRYTIFSAIIVFALLAQELILSQQDAAYKKWSSPRNILRGAFFGLVILAVTKAEYTLFDRFVDLFNFFLPMTFSNGSSIFSPASVIKSQIIFILGAIPFSIFLILAFSVIAIEKVRFRKRLIYFAGALAAFIMLLVAGYFIDDYFAKHWNTHEYSLKKLWGLTTENDKLAIIQISTAYSDLFDQKVIMVNPNEGAYTSNSSWTFFMLKRKKRPQKEENLPVSQENIDRVEKFVRENEGRSVQLYGAYEYLYNANYYLFQPEKAIPWINKMIRLNPKESYNAYSIMDHHPLREPYLSGFEEYIDDTKWFLPDQSSCSVIQPFYNRGMVEKAKHFAEKCQYPFLPSDLTKPPIMDGIIHGKIISQSPEISIKKIGLIWFMWYENYGCRLQHWHSDSKKLCLFDAATPSLDGSFEFTALGQGTYYFAALSKLAGYSITPEKIKVESSGPVTIDADHRDVNAGTIIINYDDQ